MKRDKLLASSRTSPLRGVVSGEARAGLARAGDADRRLESGLERELLTGLLRGLARDILCLEAEAGLSWNPERRWLSGGLALTILANSGLEAIVLKPASSNAAAYSSRSSGLLFAMLCATEDL